MRVKIKSSAKEILDPFAVGDVADNGEQPLAVFHLNGLARVETGNARTVGPFQV